MLKIKVIIVDDEIAALENMEHLLLLFDEIEILAKESSPEAAIEAVIRLKPDILFLDVEMPRFSGFDVLNEIDKKGYMPKIIFVTAYDRYAIKAIKSKALDYLLKPVQIDELKDAIDRYKNSFMFVLADEVYLSALSNREKDVLHLILQGKTSVQIATSLFISKTTVDTHRKNILIKTGASSTMKLITELLNK